MHFYELVFHQCIFSRSYCSRTFCSKHSTPVQADKFNVNKHTLRIHGFDNLIVYSFLQNVTKPEIKLPWNRSRCVILCLHIHNTIYARSTHPRVFYMDFTHKPDLHLKLDTTNTCTHSLHQIHITREIHQFYTLHVLKIELLKIDSRNSPEIHGVFWVFLVHTRHTPYTRKIHV